MAQGQDKGASDKRGTAGRTGKLAIMLACLIPLFIWLALSPTTARADDHKSDLIALETTEVEQTPEIIETPTVQETEVPPTATEITATPTETPTTTPFVEPTATVRWEEQTLLELADRLSWPASVIVDQGGMSLVQLVLTQHEWAQASIRPFTYGSSAEAAFEAEQEDASLAGFAVEQVSFYTYPAYLATVEGPGGTIVEQRLRWLSDTRIFGVTLHGTGPVISSLDADTIGHELLLIAINHGLPTPTGGFAPTPLPPTQGTTPSATATPVACALSFADVTPQYWAYRYIMSLACDGVVTGRSDGKFWPDSPTTRAQMAKMIVISEGWTLLNPVKASFSDISTSHVFYRYIETAYAHGILTGYPNKSFKPDGYVTRAQVAKMLVRARQWPLSLRGIAPVPLCDVPAGHWAWTYIQVAFQHNAFSGYANGCFLPDASATRAQIAKVLVQSQP